MVRTKAGRDQSMATVEDRIPELFERLAANHYIVRAQRKTMRLSDASAIFWGQRKGLHNCPEVKSPRD